MKSKTRNWVDETSIYSCTYEFLSHRYNINDSKAQGCQDLIRIILDKSVFYAIQSLHNIIYKKKGAILSNFN